MSTKITEIIPDNLPEWMRDAMNEAQLFNRMVEFVESSNKEIAELRACSERVSELNKQLAPYAPHISHEYKDIRLKETQKQAIAIIQTQAVKAFAIYYSHQAIMVHSNLSVVSVVQDYIKRIREQAK